MEVRKWFVNDFDRIGFWMVFRFSLVGIEGTLKMEVVDFMMR